MPNETISSPAIPLFQKAHSRMVTLQRVDEQLATLLEQRKRIIDELRMVQSPLAGFGVDVQHAALGTRIWRNLQVKDRRSDAAHVQHAGEGQPAKSGSNDRDGVVGRWHGQVFSWARGRSDCWMPLMSTWRPQIRRAWPGPDSSASTSGAMWG